jgi:hypothetical protein
MQKATTMKRQGRSMTTKRKNNRTITHTRAILRISLGLALLLPAGLATLAGTSAHAQQKAPVQRVADGKVVGKDDAPIAGAVVFLKDVKSLSVKSYITDDKGLFHFGNLGQNTDYELWAESDKERSKTRSISSFDSKNNYNFVLKVDKAK